jgi:hypothetical protein
MLGRLDNDPGVPSPDDEVSGLRLLDSLERFDAGVEIGGRRIAVGKPGLLVDSVNKMRAVVFGISTNPSVERSCDQRKAVVLVQYRIVILTLLLIVGSILRHNRWLGTMLQRLVLCP